MEQYNSRVKQVPVARTVDVTVNQEEGCTKVTIALGMSLINDAQEIKSLLNSV